MASTNADMGGCVDALIDEISRTPAFSIDSNERIIALEQEFLKDMPDFDDSDLRSVALYSRACNRRVLAKPSSVTVDALKACFPKGHTLAIDYTRSYTRYLAFDIDCICRKSDNSFTTCCTIATSDQIVRELISIVNAFGVIMSVSRSTAASSYRKKKMYSVSVWSYKCGFHIYTNLCVTQPTHYFIWLTLKARFVGSSVYKSAIIELPDMMPLPNSAKEYGCVYAPACYADSSSVEDLIPKADDELCYEYYKSAPINSNSSNIEGTMSSPVGDMEIVAMGEPKIDILAILPSITAFTAKPSFGNMQFAKIVNNLIQSNRKKTYIPIEPYAINFKGCEYAPHVAKFMRLFKLIIDAPNYRNSQTILINDRENNMDGLSLPSKRTDANTYRSIEAATINLDRYTGTVIENNDDDDNDGTAGDGNIIDCSEFIEYTVNRNYGMDIQHYVVAMAKYITYIQNKKVDNVIQKKKLDTVHFKKILNVLYAAHLNSIPIYNFVTNYTEVIAEAYDDTYCDMLTYLMFARNNDITVDKSMDTVATEFFNRAMSVSGTATIKMMDSKSPKLDRFLSQVEEFISMTRYVLVSMQSGRVYVLEENHYISSTKLDTQKYPRDLNSWLNGQSIVQLTSRLSKMDTMIGMTNTYFMYVTDYGVFNAITCQYVSKSPLLRFTVHRAPIFKNLLYNNKIPYNMLNEDIITHMSLAKNVIENISTVVSTIYTRGFLLPAFLGMSQETQLDDYSIVGMIDRIAAVSDLSPLYILIERYSLDPHYITLLANMLQMGGSHTIFYSYNKMCYELLRGSGSSARWMCEFPPTVIKYNKNAASHTEKLKSIVAISEVMVDGKLKSNVKLNLNEDVLVLLTMIGAFIVNCRSFAPLREAFPDIVPTSVPFIEDAEINLTRKSEQHGYYVSTVIEDIIRDVLKPRPNTNDANYYYKLLVELTSLCMSANFEMKTLNAILDTLSASFVTYNYHKKVFIYYGIGDVGKSLLCLKLYEYIKHSIYQIRDLPTAITRSNVTTESLVCIQSEMSKLNSTQIKSISGNDKDDVSRFYSQKMEHTEVQALIYGATNVHVQFSDCKTDVDRTTIDRIYVIEFKGIQPTIPGVSQFSMLMDNCYMRGMFPKDDDRHISMGMLALANYVKNRDAKTFYPALRETPETSGYRSKILFLNNSLYRVIAGARYMYHVGFYTTVLQFRSAINLYLSNLEEIDAVAPKRRKVKTTQYTYSSFCAKFLQEYNVNLDTAPNDSHIKNFQVAALIEHIKVNMQVEVDESQNITDQMYNEQLSAYAEGPTRLNAHRYFRRMNVDRHDAKLKLYRGLKFTNIVSPYADATQIVATTPDETNVSIAIAMMRKQLNVDEKSQSSTSSSMSY